MIEGKIVIDPALVKISHGNLPLPANIECVVQQSNIFRISWTPSYTNGYDQLMVLAYDIENGRAEGKIYGNDRMNGEQLVPVLAPVGKNFHIYIGFISGDRSRQSDSMYMGKYGF